MAAVHCSTCDKPYADRTGRDPCPRCGTENPSIASAVKAAATAAASSARLRALQEEKAKPPIVPPSPALDAALARRENLERARAELKRVEASRIPARALSPEEAALSVLCGRCSSGILAGATVCPFCGFGRIVPISIPTIFGYATITGLIVGALAGGAVNPGVGVAAGWLVTAMTLIFYGRESERQEQRLGRLARGQLDGERVSPS